jgi:septal ring factor EnvC (AmiA/AmiB activator)
MKFYSQILTLVAAFFGMNSESTEAEIHQRLEEAGTLEDMRAQIRQEFEQQIREQNEEIQSLGSQLAAVSEERDALQQQVNEQEERIAELEKEPAENHTNGQKETSAKEETPWLNSSINQRAMKLFPGA